MPPTADDVLTALRQLPRAEQDIFIKNGAKGGQLQLGTEVVAAADGSLAALLGASPGASTAVTIMLEVLERCFASRLATAAWQEQLKRLFPSWGGDVLSSRSRNTAVLGL